MNSMKKQFDIVSLGECLIDFVEPGKYDDNLLFSGNPGGAPANVLASAAKLGMHCALIGKVGDDVFGQFLLRQYKKAGIDVSGMIASRKEPTTLAFVSLNPDGDRDFTFYRNDTADCMLAVSDIDFSIIDSSRIFCFGSVSMSTSIAYEATIAAAKYAKEHGVLVSFDPNYRPLLWEDTSVAAGRIEQACHIADIIKLSDNEIGMLSDQTDLSDACREIIQRFGCKMVIITMGRKGAFAMIDSGICASAPAYDVDTIDTTGAGDAFLGALLTSILNSAHSPSEMNCAELEEILKKANASGSLSTTKHGAIPSMPSIDDVQNCMHFCRPAAM